MTAPARPPELMSAVASLLLRVLIHGRVANGLGTRKMALPTFHFLANPRRLAAALPLLGSALGPADQRSKLRERQARPGPVIQ